MTKMAKANRIILLIVGVLLTAIVVLAYLNMNSDDVALKRALQENRQFLLKVNGETAAVVGLQDILDMETVKFTTRLSSTTITPRNADFEGVELRAIYERLGIDISGASIFDVRGLDGYDSPLSIDEVMAEEKIYVCIAMDGAILTDKGSGGWGPFLLVIRGSTFAQRWCKYVEEINAR